MEIISALMNPEAYDEIVENIRLVQTHISWIFLTGKYAYKIKKPVDFGFLDFSTLEKRKLYCEKELELNRRLAPDMYLEVVSITQSDDKIKIKGEGKVIEYAVKMRELPQETMMLKLLEIGRVDDNLIDRIVKIISNFHSKAKIINHSDFETVKFNWDENFDQTKPFINKTIGKNEFDFIETRIKNFLKTNEKIFAKRESEGKIRDCHGDLHSGNIFITDKIYIFDAIEFNERFRFGDVANEVAFLAMDLDFHNKQDLSNYFVEKYIEYSKDKELKKVLDFYKCYRAFVRGKVTSFKLQDKTISVQEKKESEKLAKKYFDLAFNYTKRFSPILIIMSGLMGTGKSRLAKKIARKLRAKIIRSDVVRKELGKISPTTQKFEPHKKGIYSEEFTDRTYKEIIERAKENLTTASCILDATFLKRDYRKQASALAKKLGLPFFIIECICPENKIKERLEKRIKGKSVSDGRWELFYDQKKEFEPIGDDENHIVVDMSKKNDENEILKKIFT